MADIQEKILSKYNIDISKDNILKLYKIEDSNISEVDLQAKIEDARKRWQQSVNGANEKNAERDRIRLENADTYERILNDAKLRKALYEYYNKENANKAGDLGTVAFAKEFFDLVATTKKLRKKDVEFFFNYFQSERKNKKDIISMLSKEYKILGLAKDSEYVDEEETEDKEEKKKKKGSDTLIVNLFQAETIFGVKKCLEFYQKSLQSNEICTRYPLVKNGLVDFLEVIGINNIQDFQNSMSLKAKEVYAVRQERGTEYVSLVDMYNTLLSLCNKKDVMDNYHEFILLLKYPNLTPYMYLLVDAKPNTLKKLLSIALRDYTFRDEKDFILNYYKLIYDNFGILDGSLKPILKRAEKHARANKILNSIDKKIGRKNRQKISIWAEILHILVYFPIFIMYFVFEVCKTIFTKLPRLKFILFLGIVALGNWLLPKIWEVDNFLIVGKFFRHGQWKAYLETFTGVSTSGIGTFLLSVVVIGYLLLIYCIPALFFTSFFVYSTEDLNKRFEWIGIERTFQDVFAKIRRKTEEQYKEQKKKFLKKQIGKVLVNTICTVITIIIIVPIFATIGSYGSMLGSSMTQHNWDLTDNQQSVVMDAGVYKDENIGGTINTGVEESVAVDKVVLVITVKSANIRAGAGTDYDVIRTASQGMTFFSTGNQKKAENGRIWYEIYLNEECTELGWASETVITVQE